MWLYTGQPCGTYGFRSTWVNGAPERSRAKRNFCFASERGTELPSWAACEMQVLRSPAEPGKVPIQLMQPVAISAQSAQKQTYMSYHILHVACFVCMSLHGVFDDASDGRQTESATPTDFIYILVVLPHHYSDSCCQAPGRVCESLPRRCATRQPVAYGKVASSAPRRGMYVVPCRCGRKHRVFI